MSSISIMGSLGLELVGLDFAAGHFEGCLYNEMKRWLAPSLTDQDAEKSGTRPICLETVLDVSRTWPSTITARYLP